MAKARKEVMKRKYHEVQKELLENLRNPTETKVPFTELMGDAATKIEELTALLEKQMQIIRRVYVDHFPNTWFPTGGIGETDSNGLPDKIEVCPAYGVGWTQLYQKTDIIITMEGS